ncbi:MAG: group 1 truncated hemoglobin [Planctomycetes bacterium]|nr:group 1 truncated hemoglobin [Planctomycetota bacterium]
MKRRASDLAPDPEMWEALNGGDGLRTILVEFYEIIYADERLKGFFWNTTVQRAIDKQYNFLYQMFTGEKVYFGERPFNAHNWMIIDHELFDYREQVMSTCLRNYGLPEHLIQRWRSIEEVFRRHIVKDAPMPKKVRGMEIPAEGYEELEMSCGAMCDGCENEINSGELAKYHVRTGATYCRTCFPEESAEPLVKVKHPDANGNIAK